MPKDIVIKDDLYNAIRGYKYQHCPVLSGLNKTELGQLVNKYDLNVEPTGERQKPTGAGAGRRWSLNPKRKKTTWEGKKERTRDIKGMDVRFTGLLDKRKPVQEKRRDIADAEREPRRSRRIAEKTGAVRDGKRGAMRDKELARVKDELKKRRKGKLPIKGKQKIIYK